MNKILQNIGLCKKAGFIITGFDPVKCELEAERGKVFGVLVASDLSEKSRKEIKFAADKYNKPVTEIPVTMNEIEGVLRKRVGIMAISDEGLYKAIVITDNTESWGKLNGTNKNQG